MTRAAGDSSVYESYNPGRRKVVAWGIPTLGRVSMLWVRYHYELGMPTNVPVTHVYVEGKEVGDARNEIIARSLALENDEREISHVFFLDDDVLPHPATLKKLHADDLDIVSGLYFLKTPVPTPMVLMDDGVVKSWTPGDIVDCMAHGMGLTLIRMEVFKRMRDELDLGVDKFGNPQWFKTVRDHHVLRLDGTSAVHNETEDVYFLNRARSLGYTPHVDTSAEAFGWHWAQNEHRAYPLKQWFEWQKTGTVTWETAGEPVTWGKVA